MKIIIKESSVVYPAQSTPNHRIWLSNLDLYQSRVYVPTVYLYSCNSLQVEKLKEALSKVLVPFYPAAGRLARDDNGRIEIDCNGKGVLFIEAEADNYIIKDQRELLYMPVEESSQLVPTTTIDSSDISSFPLIKLQVTRLSGGKVCIGVAAHHTLGDGEVGTRFINAWSDIVRGESIDNIPSPIIDRTNLRSRVPPTPKFSHNEYDPPVPTTSIINTNKNTHISYAMFEITPQHISNLKAKAKCNGHVYSRFSSFEVISAHAWRCATKARGLPHDQLTKLYISIDGRSRFIPPIPQEFMGNVIFFCTPTALCGELISESLAQTIERIHKAIEKMDDEYLRSAIDFLEKLMEGNMDETKKGAQRDSFNPDLKITSWRHFRFYEADFGWGKPLCVRAAHGRPPEGKAHILSSPTNEGGLLLPISLDITHMQLFQQLFYYDMITISDHFDIKTAITKYVRILQ